MAVSRTDSQESETVTGAKTLDEGDSGVVQNVTATATLTLPSTALGLCYIIRNGSSGETDSEITITVSPAAADKIHGNGYTAADDKDIINTLGRGGIDEVVLLGDGSAGWFVQSVSGTWTRQA